MVSRLHYLRSGGDKPPLVLAHGFSDSAACWASLIPALCDDYDVVAYDARGHGLSDAPEFGYQTDSRVADLLGLVAALGLDRPVLMGHSMGGQTVVWAALARPELPRALILEDSGIYTAADLQQMSRAAGDTALPDWVLALRSRSREQLIRICQRQSPRWPKEDLVPWAESKLQMSPNVAGTFAGPRKDASESFSSICCPVLFLKADASEEVKREHRAIVAPTARCDAGSHSGRRAQRAAATIASRPSRSCDASSHGV